MLAKLVPPHQVFHGLVRCEVDGMRGAWRAVSRYATYSVVGGQAIPAPTTTLDIPLHRLMKPSPDAILNVPWIMPL